MRTLLEERGESLEWLAEAAEIPLWDLFAVLELRSRPMSVAMAADLADALGVEMPCLIYGTEGAIS